MTDRRAHRPAHRGLRAALALVGAILLVVGLWILTTPMDFGYFAYTAPDDIEVFPGPGAYLRGAVVTGLGLGLLGGLLGYSLGRRSASRTTTPSSG